MNWLDKYEKGGEVNANEEYVSIPPNFVGSGHDISGRKFSPAWGGQFEDGGELEYIVNNKPISKLEGLKLDSLSNRLKDLQYEQTKTFKSKFPNIPVDSILSTEDRNKSFRNSYLDQKADSLNSIYGDANIPISEDYLNTAREYGNLLNIAGQTQDIIGEKEQGLKNFGYRTMLYKHLHPQNTSAYKMLEEKENGGQIAKDGINVAQQDATKVNIPKYSNDISKHNYTKLDERIHKLIPQHEYPENKGAVLRAIKSIITNTQIDPSIYFENDIDKDKELLKEKYGEGSGAGDELFKIALGYNDKLKYIEQSPYKPSKSKDSNAKYLRIKDLDKKEFFQKAISELNSIDSKVVDWGMVPSTNEKNTHGLANFTISKGEDEYGKYVSYYDKYDFDTPIVNSVLDKTPEVYDRVYYKDNPYKKEYEKLRQTRDSLWDVAIKTQSKSILKELDKAYDDQTKLINRADSAGTSVIAPGIVIDDRATAFQKYFPIKKNGGELQKLDQLTNFNNFGQDKKWLNKYK